MEKFYYRTLDVYQRAKGLANRIYDVTEAFPHTEMYALSNQLQRAAISVMSNIAEGLGRFSYKERVHFLDIANGSLMEISSQLELAEMRHYIGTPCLQQFDDDILIIVKQIAKLRSKFINQSNTSPSTQSPTPNT